MKIGTTLIMALCDLGYHRFKDALASLTGKRLHFTVGKKT